MSLTTTNKQATDILMKEAYIKVNAEGNLAEIHFHSIDGCLI